MLNVALTHDVDRTKKTYQYITHGLKCISQFNVSGFLYQFNSLWKPNPYWMFPELIKIEQDFGVKSTFFFLNESIRFEIFKSKSFVLSQGRYNISESKIVNLIKWLDENGWEIGVHGSFNSYKNINLLRYEKKVLEEILGHQVIGIRQHYLNLNSETWYIQHSVGFKYDSSFGSTRSIGFVDNKYLPFRPLNNEFTVFPQVIMDTCFMANKSRWSELDKYFDICERKKAILVVNFHNHVFNVKEFPGFRDAYGKIIERGKERGGDFRTLSEHLKIMLSNRSTQQ